MPKTVFYWCLLLSPTYIPVSSISERDVFFFTPHILLGALAVRAYLHTGPAVGAMRRHSPDCCIISCEPDIFWLAAISYEPDVPLALLAAVAASK